MNRAPSIGGPFTRVEFDQWYAGGNGHRVLFSPDETPRYDAIRRQLDACRAARGALRILDAGCGNGRLAAELPAGDLPGYLGVDFSAAAIDRARATVPAARFEVGDLVFWRPGAGASFDVVLLNEVTYYLPEAGAILRAFARSLAPNGALIVSVFRHPGWQRHWEILETGFARVAAETVTTARATWDVCTLTRA
jgi:SAM-dependent methyltransferase